MATKPPALLLDVRVQVRFPCPFCDWQGPARDDGPKAFADLLRHLGHDPYAVGMVPS